jgi:hypothetical protein
LIVLVFLYLAISKMYFPPKYHCICRGFRQINILGKREEDNLIPNYEHGL